MSSIQNNIIFKAKTIKHRNKEKISNFLYISYSKIFNKGIYIANETNLIISNITSK